VIDIGANDGTLLTPFKDLGAKVLGVEPSQAADVATSRGVAMVKDYFSKATAARVAAEHGKARVVTAANVFAHITDVHGVVDAIKNLVAPGGVFISENHYLLPLVETLQYDTVYHEHLRYYSVGSLAQLFERHELEIIHVERIPTHGGSVRVFAAAVGSRAVEPSVKQAIEAERAFGLEDGSALADFRQRVAQSKLDLMEILAGVKRRGERVFGVGAPSRSSTLVTHVGLDANVIDCVVEVKGSHKIGKYMPGTLIPVVDEERLYREQPDYALLLSWHIAEELAENLRKRGYRGRFITPLPKPAIL
jgi:SAM-dependent methyltransferase